MVRSAEALFGSKKIAEALGVPLSRRKRWLQTLRSGDDMVPRNVGRPRGGEARLFLLSLTSLDLRAICGFFSLGPMIKSGACSCQDAYCWHHCRHTMLHSRPCSQTSAGIWHGARPQQRPGSPGGGAPGSRHKFLLPLDKAPSHACWLACDHYKRVLHGTVEFQSPCSPDLSSFDFLL